MMSNTGNVIAVNISEQKGTIKHPVPEITIDNHGIVDDAHAGNWHRQISLLSQKSINKFSQQFNRKINHGEFAENLTITGIDLNKAAILDRFRIGDVELELTQIGKECHGNDCAIFREVGQCVMPKEGVFCRVIHGGKIKPNDPIKHFPRPLQIQLITLSDRAFAGEYEDKSGSMAQDILTKFFAYKRWHWQINAVILPDNAAKLELYLQNLIAKKADIIFTLGGTGIGSRDITPEVVTEICDKIIPGIMDNIRIKYGAEKSNSLLSRSVAGVVAETQIYALPGSVKAVQEYMQEILPLLEHMIFMLHSIDAHC